MLLCNIVGSFQSKMFVLLGLFLKACELMDYIRLAKIRYDSKYNSMMGYVIVTVCVRLRRFHSRDYNDYMIKI